MTKGILAAGLATLLTFSQAFACDEHGKSGFAPENTMQIFAGDKAANNMTEELFLATIKKVSDVYAPIVAKQGSTLKMNNRWDDPTVNASAQQSGKTWIVNMYGGLARHEYTTTDGFMMVVCHELGHHLGGAPRKSSMWGGTSWASNEGQADYWAALKCMKRVLESEDNVAYVSNIEVEPTATERCQAMHTTANEIALCQRLAMAGKSLALVLGSLANNTNLDFLTPDTKVVGRTNDNHPAAQCRLDTYFSGSLCNKDFNEDVSPVDPIRGNCIKRDGYSMGVRPLCWYKPGNDEI